MEFLGSPVYGTQKIFDSCFSKRIEKIQECQEHQYDMENLQVELHLLRSCLFLCKINHLLRTVLPDKCLLQLSRFDINLHNCLEAIVNSSISENSWNQATFPICSGGLGLREAYRTCLATFL